MLIDQWFNLPKFFLRRGTAKSRLGFNLAATVGIASETHDV
jgi:hypothetical protein